MDILIIAVLIIAAVILFLVELFVIPGISLAGISALVCIVYANFYAFANLGMGGRIYHFRNIGSNLYRLFGLVHAIKRCWTNWL